METIARKKSGIDHEGVLHKPGQFDRPSNSASASDELNGLKAKLKIADNKDPSITSSWCIYKVPPKLRKVNEEAFTPCVVSIGPYHHENTRLKPMEELKVWYLNKFLNKTPDPEKSLEDYFNALKDKEDEIRCCYSETIHMESHEFVSMILIDACFIIEFFLAAVGKGVHLVQKLWPTFDIFNDLILLENQLPFFVLTYLFDDLTFPRGFNGTSFVKLTFDVFVGFFFRQIYPLNKETNDMFIIRFNHGDNLKQGLHLCDVLRNCFFPRDPPPRNHTAINISNSASQLHQAGIKFQADKESFLTKLRTCFLPRDPPPRQPPTPMICSQSVSQSNEAGMELQADKESFLRKLWTCFLPRHPPPRQPPTVMNCSHSVSEPHEAEMEICSHSVSQLHEAGMEFQADKKSFLTELRYSNEVLTIPRILISDSTQTLLRNVIAFEQCHYYPSSSYVTDYVSLLDYLINNGKDVDILVGKKIMVNLLGDSNEVSSMVNKLCSNVTLKGNEDYISLYREMDKFCENRYHKYKAIFVREYWSTPWRIASVIAASLLLLLTFIQTMSSVI